MLPGQILIPLITAFLYALSMIFLKRALQEGTGTWRVTFVSNMVMALGYQGCWALHTQPFSMAGALWATLAAFTFFSGQVFTFLAFSQGDVSVVTPLLGTKVIWVAGFSVLLAGRTLSPQIWLAAFLTAVGTAILGYQPGARRRRVALSIGAAVATSCSFGLTDVLVQRFAPAWGFGSFVPTMFLMVGVFSFGFIPFMSGRGWAPVWLGTGSVMLAIQALGMAFAITTFGQATITNIAYNTRGLWSIAMIWAFGHWFGNTERDSGTRAMLLRLGGAVLLVAAILIAVR